MIRANTRKVRLRAGGLLALLFCAWVAAPIVHAACIGQQIGDLAKMEELAFRDPATALPQLANIISTASDMPPMRRAAASRHRVRPESGHRSHHACRRTHARAVERHVD